MTVREWFRQMRAADFERDAARLLDVQARVEEATADAYPAHAWDLHAAWGCDCATCTRWRLGIYNAGCWPRPRTFNGERT